MSSFKHLVFKKKHFKTALGFGREMRVCDTCVEMAYAANQQNWFFRAQTSTRNCIYLYSLVTVLPWCLSFQTIGVNNTSNYD